MANEPTPISAAAALKGMKLQPLMEGAHSGDFASNAGYFGVVNANGKLTGRLRGISPETMSGDRFGNEIFGFGPQGGGTGKINTAESILKMAGVQGTGIGKMRNELVQAITRTPQGSRWSIDLEKVGEWVDASRAQSGEFGAIEPKPIADFGVIGPEIDIDITAALNGPSTSQSALPGS